jgi:hypothetical protein
MADIAHKAVKQTLRHNLGLIDMGQVDRHLAVILADGGSRIAPDELEVFELTALAMGV